MSHHLPASETTIEGKVACSQLTMGVGVDAPGRDHHSMTSPSQQGHSMTNGFSSDNHGRSNGGKFKSTKLQLKDYCNR